MRYELFEMTCRMGTKLTIGKLWLTADIFERVVRGHLLRLLGVSDETINRVLITG